MQLDDCFELGYITGTKGLRGELQAFLDVDFPDQYQDLDALFVLSGQHLVPYSIERISVQGHTAVIKLEDIDQVDQANPLKSSKLYIPLSALPDLEPDQFYFHDLIGFEMTDHQKGDLGPVKSIYNLPGNDLFSIDYQGKEVLVPIQRDLIVEINRDEKTIVIALPDGLLEIYLES